MELNKITVKRIIKFKVFNKTITLKIPVLLRTKNSAHGEWELKTKDNE